MKQRVLFLLTGLMLLASGFTAQGQAPTISDPSTNGATVSVCGFNVTAQGTDVRTRRLIISLFDTNFDPVLDGNGNAISFIVPRTSATSQSPVSVSIPGSALSPNTNYIVYVEAYGLPVSNFLGDAQRDVTTGPSPGSPNPSITAPTNGATGVSITPTINVAAYAGCGNLTSAIIEIDRDLSFTNPDYQQTVDNTGNGPFSWTPPTELNYNTLYYVRVRFLQGATEVGATTISFTTQPITPTNPFVVSPLEGAIVSTCSPVVLTVNANNVAARRIRYEVYNWGAGPGFNVINGTNNPEEVTLTASEATSSFNLPPIPASVFSNLTDYGIELTTLDANNNVIGGLIAYRFAIGPDQTSAAANTPVITSPVDGSTVNTFTPTITIDDPFEGCQLNSVLYEILLGTSGSTVVFSESFNTPTYSWTVPPFLAAGATYRARVTYNVTVNGSNLSYSDVNVFTVSASPQAQLVTPTTLTDLNPCGFSGSAALYPAAGTMRIEYRLLPSGAFSTLVDAALAGNVYPFSFGNTQLQANANYELRITAGNGSGGSFVPITGSDNTYSFSTGGISNAAVAIASPANGATGVSLTPTFVPAAYTGECGSVIRYSIALRPVSEPWNPSPVPDDNFRFLNTSIDGFTIINPLLPNTTYKVRITTFVSLNGGETFYENYLDDSFTFTTVTDPFETSLQLVTSESNVFDGVRYLNSAVQNFQLTPVSDPRVRSYEIQISSDPGFATTQYTANSATNLFSFPPTAGTLESSTLYYIRARVLYDADNNAGTPDIAGPWTSAGNVQAFVNSLHPTFADRPVGNINSNVAPLRGWHMRNATSMFFQIATDPAFTNLVNAAGPYGPILSDPANPSQIAYERYSYRRWIGPSLINVPISDVNNAGLASFNTFGEYQYLRYLVPGQTYYTRVKNVRQAADGTYLQLGYWGITTTFTTPAYTRTHAIGIGGAPNNAFVNFTNESIYIGSLPDGVWNLSAVQLQISTDPTFSSLVVDVLNSGVLGSATAVAPNVILNYSTTYYVRVRSQALNDLLGSTNWTPWTEITIRTLDPPSGRAAAAATSTDGQVMQNTAFPNPFTESVGVSLKSEYGDVKVSMHDQTGRSVENVQSRGGNTVVMGRQAAKGFYVIRITDRNGLLETLKVVKQ